MPNQAAAPAFTATPPAQVPPAGLAMPRMTTTPGAAAPTSAPAVTPQAPAAPASPQSWAQPGAYGDPIFGTQIDVGPAYSPRDTAVGMGDIWAQGQQTAASAMRGNSLPGFSSASPGLQARGMAGAANALGAAMGGAEQLRMEDTFANAQQIMGGQQARFNDWLGQAQNFAQMQEERDRYALANRDFNVQAGQAQQASDVNWLNMALQGQMANQNNWLDWANNQYGLQLGEAQAGQQYRNSFLNALMGLY